MNVFRNLFAKSPFEPLQSHMEKVAICVNKVTNLFEAYYQRDFKKLKKVAQEISELEHAADLTKNEIRNNLPKGLFLAVNRADLLEILSLQDRMADKAEDIGVMMTLKKLEPLEGLEDELQKFIDKNIEAANYVHKIMQEMDELLEASFGGKEAEKVKKMIEEVAYLEHQADVLQSELNKKLYNMDSKLSVSSFILWNNILQAIASLSNNAEKLANRVRMLLEIH
ncbi:MAG: TIGR00153 family protein [Calditrichaeota bacterium]|nr:TIGR00153 family protein [Calditrichota bacterium]MCB0267621.1 TIGR00153 family protein [Calditrichota bacterium]MCB0285147.1 TIGR00153 family protein [Calditrichota bacterium]MCB0301229.1 TIGR00153 family protein [Calditrichota bacterium]MCB9069797.1 TIGR00153 family protein [Calditrichia bacterium]